MSNICKTVTLRTRKIKKGTQLSFYLDYYPGYRDESTMKVQRHESLGIYIFAKPKNQRERDYNERMSEKAEALRCRRYESIVNERYDFFDREKEKGNFLAWFKKKADARKTKWQLMAYISIIWSAIPLARIVSRFFTVSGWKVPSRSRGVSIVTSPYFV